MKNDALNSVRKCSKVFNQFASLLFELLGVPIEIGEYAEYGRDAHATADAGLIRENYFGDQRYQ